VVGEWPQPIAGENKMKSNKQSIKRQKQIGKIFRQLVKEGVSIQTAIKAALFSTQE
jgi:hypothetical protein